MVTIHPNITADHRDIPQFDFLNLSLASLHCFCPENAGRVVENHLNTRKQNTEAHSLSFKMNGFAQRKKHFIIFVGRQRFRQDVYYVNVDVYDM